MLPARKAERIGTLFASLLFAAGAVGFGFQIYRRWRAKPSGAPGSTEFARPLAPALRAKIVQRLQVAYFQSAPLGSGVTIYTGEHDPAIEPVAAELEALLKAANVPVRRRQEPLAQGAQTEKIRLAYHPAIERYGHDLGGILGLMMNIEDAAIGPDPSASPLTVRVFLRGTPRFLEDGSVVLR